MGHDPNSSAFTVDWKLHNFRALETPICPQIMLNSYRILLMAIMTGERKLNFLKRNLHTGISKLLKTSMSPLFYTESPVLLLI